MYKNNKHNSAAEPLTSVLLCFDLGLQVFRVDILVVFIVVRWFTLPTAETTAAATAAAGEQRTAQDQTLQEVTSKQNNF